MKTVFRERRIAKCGGLFLIGASGLLMMGCGSKPDGHPSVDPGAVQTITPGQGNSLPTGTKAVQAPPPSGATGSTSDTFVKPGG